MAKDKREEKVRRVDGGEMCGLRGKRSSKQNQRARCVSVCCGGEVKRSERASGRQAQLRRKGTERGEIGWWRRFSKVRGRESGWE